MAQTAHPIPNIILWQVRNKRHRSFFERVREQSTLSYIRCVCGFFTLALEDLSPFVVAESVLGVAEGPDDFFQFSFVGCGWVPFARCVVCLGYQGLFLIQGNELVALSVQSSMFHIMPRYCFGRRTRWTSCNVLSSANLEDMDWSESTIVADMQYMPGD